MEDDAGAAQWRDRITAQDDPAAKLEAFAHWSAAMFATSKTTITATLGAIGDPAILELRDEANRHRRQALTALVGTLADRGALTAGLSQQQAVDRAWDADRRRALPRRHRRLRLDQRRLRTLARQPAGTPAPGELTAGLILQQQFVIGCMSPLVVACSGAVLVGVFASWTRPRRQCGRVRP